MGSAYLTLDHPRVELKCSRLGRIFSLSGQDQTPSYPYPHTIKRNGCHLEPRMGSVMVPPKSFNLNSGDYARITVEDTPLVGIVVELADHHYDLKVLIDGEDIYGDFYTLSTYLPSSDGFGKIHWLLLDREKHEITLLVSEKYNRMLDASEIKPSHACVSGFLLGDGVSFPPPVYHQWMYTQDPIPPDTRGRSSHFKNNLLPPGGQIYLMDLYGQGSLETLYFEIDGPSILEVMDGGPAQPEYPNDFPSWIRRVDLGNPTSGAFSSVIDCIEAQGSGRLQVRLLKPIQYASRLIIRLSNQTSNESQINNLYLEGSNQCR